MGQAREAEAQKSRRCWLGDRACHDAGRRIPSEVGDTQGIEFDVRAAREVENDEVPGLTRLEDQVGVDGFAQERLVDIDVVDTHRQAGILRPQL